MKLKIIHYLLLLILSFSICNPCVAFTETTNQRIANKLLNSVENKPLTDRIALLSSALLNKPYQFEPLGEGPNGKYNQQPLYRFDRFDCETYVNTVLALAFAKDVADIQQKIQKINYLNGEISFTHRAHFTDVDWVPNNIRNGFIEDITTKVAGANNVATAVIYNDRKSWYLHLPIDRIKITNLTPVQKQAKLAELHAEANKATNNWSNISYIPFNFLINGKVSYQNIPNDSIVLFIHHDPDQMKAIGTEVAVSHMGFVIWRGGVPYLRHASSVYHKTLDLPLVSYLHWCALEPKMKGIAVFMPINNNLMSLSSDSNK